MKKSERIILLGLLLACVFAVAFFITSLNSRSDNENEGKKNLDKDDIEYFLVAGGYRFANQISIENDNGIFIGVLSGELDSVLLGLCQAFNSDPSSAFQVEANYIRDCLTLNLGDAVAKRDEDAYKPLVAFLEWCGQPANLVYRENGEPWASGIDIENYRFILGREEFPQLEYKYEFKAEQSK